VSEPGFPALQQIVLDSTDARLLLDRCDDPAERLFVYADPDGHPFCIFVDDDRTRYCPRTSG
jgi:hypothetical protein